MLKQYADILLIILCVVHFRQKWRRYRVLLSGGDGDIDHKYWQSPEIDAMSRPAYFATSGNTTTDDVSQSAAALAINYYNFIDTDPEYAEKCLDYAKALYSFAEKNKKAVGDSADGPKKLLHLK